LPIDLLADVKGADARVEFAVLTAEYWTQPGISPFLAHSELLKTLPEYLDAYNIDAFVRLLSRRGHAEAFFNLLRDDVDRREELRKFLQTLGLFEDTYIQYATFATNPKLLLDGFLYGLGESFSAIVKSLPEMAKLVWRAVEEWRLLVFLSMVSPSAAEARAGSDIATLMIVWDGVKEKLNPIHLPAAAWNQFNTWKKEFGDHLQNARPFEAGRVLGKAGGDLYQLLTGVVGMAKLARLTAKAAVEYAPLLLTSVRELAKRGSASVVMLARFIALQGPKVLQALPRVGMATLTTLFPPDILKRVVKGAAGIYYEFGRFKVCMVTPPAFAVAGAGALDGRFAFMVMEGEKPILLAAATETVPSIQVAEEAAAAAKVLDEPPLWNVTEKEIDEFLEATFRELAEQGKPPRLVDATETAVLAARWAQLSVRLEQRLGAFIRGIAFRGFRDALARKGTVIPPLLGTANHAEAAKELTTLIAEVAPNVRPITEETLREALATIAGMDKRLAPMAAKAQALSNETVVKFLLRRQDLLKVLGVEGTDEAAIVKFVKRWGYDASTQIGNLRSDALLIDTELATIRNIDWTSSTRMEKFEKAWRKIADSLGPSAPQGLKAEQVGSVNWEAIAQKYRAMFSGKGLPKETAEAIEDLKQLQAHAQRETVLRKAIIEEAIEHAKWSWHVSSQEILYPGVNELFKLLK